MNKFSMSLLLGASLLTAACGGGNETASEGEAANAASEELTFNGANDLSAMDMAANESVGEPLPSNMTAPVETNAAGETNTTDAPADSGQVESNVSGM